MGPGRGSLESELPSLFLCILQVIQIAVLFWVSSRIFFCIGGGGGGRRGKGEANSRTPCLTFTLQGGAKKTLRFAVNNNC